MSRPPIHPGEILADELQELGITPTALARQLAVPPNRITQIIQGKRSITGERRFAWRTGSDSPQFWLNLQSSYEIEVARGKAGAEIEKLPTQGCCGLDADE